MLIEQCAYSNKWRQVHPAAKGLFTCCGLVAAFMATSPAAFCVMTVVLLTTTIAGAGIPWRQYLRVFLPPLLFLAISCATLAVSLHWNVSPFRLAVHLEQSQLPHVALVCGRSLTSLAALLFLSLTTPMTDLISLLRRFRVPDVLLEMMTLCYRTLFLLLEAIHDMRVAQSSRLGYATNRLALRSLGSMIANLTVQVWQRANALQVAALARNNDGPLCFLNSEYHQSGRSILLASTAGCALLVMSVVMP